MNRFKTLLPRIGLIVAGVAVGLLARQVLGPPDESDRPKMTIDRPIGNDVEPVSYTHLTLPTTPYV